MILKYNSTFFLKNGDRYEIANVEIKYSRIKKKNIIVVSGTGEYGSVDETQAKAYTFKELEKELVG